MDPLDTSTDGTLDGEAAVDTPTLGRSRRNAIRLAGAAAVGGVAALAAGHTAAADDGVGLIAGAPTTAAAPVRTRYTGAAGNIGYLFESGTASTSNSTSFPAVVGAWAKNTGGPLYGIYAYSERPSGAGVFGEAVGANGIGISGMGTQFGVEGRNAAPFGGIGVYGEAMGLGGFGVIGTCANGVDGFGVRGSGSTIGVQGISPVSGVLGESAAGVGVVGISTTGTGVEGRSASTTKPGVLGSTRVDGGVGVQGICDRPGTSGVQGFGHRFGGVFESTGTGIGLSASGGRAPLLLAPEGVAAPSRTEAHASGEIVVDATGDFWVCVAPGTPGTWRKLAGPSTAGAFHAIEPARVYDSRRVMTPTANGPLSAGQNRVIPVADRRDPTTGVVAAANVVPAGATAIAYNVTVTATSGSGFAYVAPGDATEISASTINWSASNSGAIANAAIVKLDASRRIKVFIGGVAGSTELIIDITGYYR